MSKALETLAAGDKTMREFVAAAADVAEENKRMRALLERQYDINVAPYSEDGNDDWLKAGDGLHADIAQFLGRPAGIECGGNKT